jgi:hypothetical protein
VLVADTDIDKAIPHSCECCVSEKQPVDKTRVFIGNLEVKDTMVTVNTHQSKTNLVGFCFTKHTENCNNMFKNNACSSNTEICRYCNGNLEARRVALGAVTALMLANGDVCVWKLLIFCFFKCVHC